MRKKKLSGPDEQIRKIQEAKRRRVRLLAMKERGASYQDIADAERISRARAQQLVNQAKGKM